MHIYQLLLVGSIILMLMLIILVGMINQKKQIHYAVMGIAISLLLWNTSVLAQISFPTTPWILIVSEKGYFAGIIFVSLAVLLTGLIFSQIRIQLSWKYALLLIIPMISLIVLLTNAHHHMFYTTFSLIPSQQDFGFFYKIHTVYSYLSVGIGLLFIMSFAVKNYGFFSRQAFLIFFALMIALVADSFSTFHIFNWSAAVENVIFSVTVIIFILAIKKYNFLSVVPIALQTAVDLISDVFVVFSEEFEIIDFNKSFDMNWDGVERRAGIGQVIKRNCQSFDEEQFYELVNGAAWKQTKEDFEIERILMGNTKYYMSEITPIIVKGQHVGTIMLIKDITEQKNNLEEVIRLNEKLQSLATKDWLTQAYNRYYFDERLEQAIEQLQYSQVHGTEEKNFSSGLGLIMFDIDYFKIYNDLNGHQAGDELLQSMVEMVKTEISSDDVLCRYGGEEFAVICAHTSIDNLIITAENIRYLVEQYEFKHQETQPSGTLTVSVGVAYCDIPACKGSDLIHEADQNLYKAKNSGKNRVVV